MNIRVRCFYNILQSPKDEIVEWHHGVNGREFEQSPGDTERRESLACCGL